MEAESHIFESPSTRLRVRSAAGAAHDPLLGAGQLWGMDELRFRQFVGCMRRFGASASYLPAGAAGRRRAGQIEVSGGTAIIQMRGILSKGGTFELFGAQLGSSTVDVGEQIDRAAAEETVKSVILLIDSPGGTLAGTQDLADKVAAAAAKKPVVAYLEDCGCACAYWIGSQARAVYANRTAFVGSLGTFAVIEDWAKGFENAGIKVHIVRSGDFKGMGIEGTPVTDAHLKEIRRIVDSINEHFLLAVAKGRRLSMSRVRELADGRSHIGGDALALKLIDGVESLDATLARLQKDHRRSPSDEGE